jgi:hypothetical protein
LRKVAKHAAVYRVVFFGKNQARGAFHATTIIQASNSNSANF